MKLRELYESFDSYNIYKVERDEYGHASTFLERVKVPFQTLVELFGEPTVDEDPNADIAVMWGIRVHYAERGSEAERHNEPESMDLMISLKKYDLNDSEYESYSREGEWMLHGPSYNQWDAKMLASEILSKKISAK